MSFFKNVATVSVSFTCNTEQVVISDAVWTAQETVVELLGGLIP